MVDPQIILLNMFEQSFIHFSSRDVSKALGRSSVKWIHDLKATRRLREMSWQLGGKEVNKVIRDSN